MMELVYTEIETSNKTVLQIKEFCKNNEIPVTNKILNDKESVQKLEVDEGPDKPWIVFIMDSAMVDFMETCGKTVAKLIKLTTRPNKIVYFTLVEKERMEMLDADFSSFVNTLDELRGIINKKTPAEFDEISNTCATMNLESFEPQPNNCNKNGPNQNSTDPDNEKTSQQLNQTPSSGNGNQKSLSSVSTNRLYPSLLTSYVAAGVSHQTLDSPPTDHSIPRNSFDSSGPPAMPCQSGMGYFCNSMPQGSDRSHDNPKYYPLHPASITESETGKPMTMNNFSYRPEILDLNRNFAPPFNPNILTDGSDNRLSCERCGHSAPLKKQQMVSDIGSSAATTCNSAGGASGMTEKDNTFDNADTKMFIWDLKEDVMVMIRDSLDCAETYNWKKLADIHKWSFGDIYRLEQKWKRGKVDSPFMHLIEGFQHYTLYDLKADLSKIPRRDLLHKITDLQCKGMLFHS